MVRSHGKTFHLAAGGPLGQLTEEKLSVEGS